MDSPQNQNIPQQPVVATPSVVTSTIAPTANAALVPGVRTVPGTFTLLKEAWDVLTHNLEVFLGFSAVNAVLSIAYTYVLEKKMDSSMVLVVFMVLMFVSLLSYAAFIFTAKEPTLLFPEILSRSTKVVPRLLGVSIIMGVLLLVIFIPLVIIALVASFALLGITTADVTQLLQNPALLLQTGNLEVVIAVILSFIGLAIVALSVFSVFVSFAPIVSIEEGGVWRAIRRSVQLVRHKFWAVLGRLFVTSIISMLLLFIWAAAVELSGQKDSFVLTVLNELPMLILTPLLTIFMYRLYTYLKPVSA